MELMPLHRGEGAVALELLLQELDRDADVLARVTRKIEMPR
jgi:hypothetical protein